MGHPTTAMPPHNSRTQNPPPAEPATPAPVAPAPDLTLSKIFAVAGAGATSAVLGSLFGVAGTVLGAAIGAVLSTVATTLYQRSLDRARSAVTARLRPQGPTSTDELDTVIMAPPVRPGEQPTELIAPADLPGRSRRRIVGYVLATVIGFAIALGLVTGIEALKGSTLLRGESGTSVGRVLQGGPQSATPTPEPSNSDEEGGGKSQYDHNSENDTENPTTEPTRSGQPTSATPTPSATPSTEPTDGLGGLLGGSNGGSNGSGGSDQSGNG